MWCRGTWLRSRLGTMRRQAASALSTSTPTPAPPPSRARHISGHFLLTHCSDAKLPTFSAERVYETPVTLFVDPSERSEEVRGGAQHACDAWPGRSCTR